MKDIEIDWKNKEDCTKLTDINNWYLHDKKDLLVIEDFEDITHYLNLDLIEGFTIEDK